MKTKILPLALFSLLMAGCGTNFTSQISNEQPFKNSSSADNGIVLYSSTESSKGDSSNIETSSEVKPSSSKTNSIVQYSSENSSKDNSIYSSGEGTSTVISNSTSEVPSSNEPVDYGDFKVETEDGTVTIDGSVFLISKAGTYNVSGTIGEGIIKVEAGDEDAVVINLNNVSITSEVNSPIYILNADEVEIHSEKGYTNTIVDNRDHKEEDNDNLGNGAIYAKCDLSFTGKGTLNVTANYNNGIHTTKDLKIKNNVINVESYNNSLKGNDSVTIKSGTLKLISTGGNGIVTEDSDVSDKGNQRGLITIEGGKTTIYSCKDGIDASYNIVVNNTVEKDGSITIPEINVYTSNYSQYSGEVIDQVGTTRYLKTTSYSSNYRYSIYYLMNGTYYWADCSYYTSQSESSGNNYGGYGGPGGGSRKTYYFYKYELPTNAVAIQIYCFTSGQTNSTETYSYKSDLINVNANYDTLMFSLSSSGISLDSWTTYTTVQQGGQPGGYGGMGGPGGMSEGNNNKSSYSAKGFKADNEIIINGGKTFIKSYDDALHANYGTTLGNEETGKGDITITDGSLELYAADDALHADRYLNIQGGTVVVTSSYEGIEANVINISGGDTTVYATDDGVNAAKKANLNVQINVSGGKLDVTVASGDTDGIDSNGSYTQTGGIVITRGSGGNMSTGLDCDGSASISGGTFIAFGRTETSLKTSGNVKTQTISATFSTGTYTFSINDVDITTTNTKMSYSNAYIYSELGNTFTYTKN